MSVSNNAVAFSALEAPDANTGEERLTQLRDKYGRLHGHALLEAMFHEVFIDKIALSSSFGAEAAVLLKLVADVDPSIPVLFIDTGHLFEETKQYKETLQKHLGLTNIHTIVPETIHLENVDKDGTLHERDTDYCCHIRKVLPFEKALAPYQAWVSGRKRFQNDDRAALESLELDEDGRFKINPLYDWDYDTIITQFNELNLPRHPLVEKGFPSIGCGPCTRAVKDGEDQRAGRWSGKGKTECGIHKSPSFEALWI